MKTLRSRGHKALLTLLKDARREAGMTQRELAEHLGKTQAHIWKVETGERRIDPVECAAWAQACGLAPKVFFNRFAEALGRRL